MFRYIIPAVTTISFLNVSIAEPNANKTYPNQGFVQETSHTSVGTTTHNNMPNDSSTMHNNMKTNSMAGSGDINNHASINDTSNSGMKTPMDTPMNTTSSSNNTSSSDMNTPMNTTPSSGDTSNSMKTSMDTNSSTTQDSANLDGVTLPKNGPIESPNSMSHGAVEGQNSMNPRK